MTTELTKRDLFAAIALHAYLSGENMHGERARANPDIVAAWAVEHADALLKTLEQPK